MFLTFKHIAASSPCNISSRGNVWKKNYALKLKLQINLKKKKIDKINPSSAVSYTIANQHDFLQKFLTLIFYTTGVISKFSVKRKIYWALWKIYEFIDLFANDKTQYTNDKSNLQTPEFEYYINIKLIPKPSFSFLFYTFAYRAFDHLPYFWYDQRVGNIRHLGCAYLGPYSLSRLLCIIHETRDSSLVDGVERLFSSSFFKRKHPKGNCWLSTCFQNQEIEALFPGSLAKIADIHTQKNFWSEILTFWDVCAHISLIEIYKT